MSGAGGACQGGSESWGSWVKGQAPAVCPLPLAPQGWPDPECWPLKALAAPGACRTPSGPASASPAGGRRRSLVPWARPLPDIWSLRSSDSTVAAGPGGSWPTNPWHDVRESLPLAARLIPRSIPTARCPGVPQLGPGRWAVGGEARTSSVSPGISCNAGDRHRHRVVHKPTRTARAEPKD